MTDPRTRHADSLAMQSRMFAFVETVAGLSPYPEDTDSLAELLVNDLRERARSILEGKAP